MIDPPRARSPIAALLVLVSASFAGADAADTFQNPLKVRGADPWLVWHDGAYYLATTTGTDIQIRKASRLGDLKAADDVVVWSRDQARRRPDTSRDLWAPEFHRLDAGTGLGPRWYLYFTATDGPEPDHRMFVLESDRDDPMGPYHFKARLRTDPDDRYYAIDGSILARDDGSLYFLWCGRPSPAGQGLFIARMSNPWTIDGPRTAIEADGFGCPDVREGPVVLRRNGRTFLTYSACPADTPDYRLGMLEADDDADPLDPLSWKQVPGPIFARSDRNRSYGPGHHGFFRSPDGKEDWIVYHAKVGTGVTFADRTTRAQRIGWTAEGRPDLGEPVATGVNLAPPAGEIR